MSSSMHSRRKAFKRHLHRLEHRAPAPSSTSLVSESPSPSASSVTAASLPSTSVAAIASVLSVAVVAILLGIVICVYRKHRLRTANASPNVLAGKVIVEKGYQSCSVDRIDLTNVSIYAEKPEKAVLAPRSFDEPAGWVPQVRAYPPSNLTPPEPTVYPKKKKFPNLYVTTPQSPPPSYLMVDRAPVENQSPHPIPVSPPNLTTCVPPPTSPAKKRTKMSPVSLAEEPVQLLSARSESFTHQDLVYPKEPSSPNPGEHTEKLPRLMNVSASFTPTLDDELAIKIGDIVRMLEEYHDGWCLIQRVGRIDAPKGAVPRCCLQERRGVASIAASRKYSTGSLKSHHSTRRETSQ